MGLDVPVSDDVPIYRHEAVNVSARFARPAIRSRSLGTEKRHWFPSRKLSLNWTALSRCRAVSDSRPAGFASTQRSSEGGVSLARYESTGHHEWSKAGKGSMSDDNYRSGGRA